MEIRTVGTLAITDAPHISAARRLSTGIARSLGFDEGSIAKIAIVVTEAVTNVVRHAREGEIVINAAAGPAMSFIVLDKGPGIKNLADALRDGYSTSGGAGTGLGAMMRMADRFEIYSSPGAGTCLLLVMGHPVSAGPGAPSIGGISVPYPGEEVCGDAWAYQRSGRRTRVLVVDGLGHGAAAADAADAAIAAFNSAAASGAGVAGVIETIHAALRGTRGAVAAVGDVDPQAGAITFCGIGNISAAITGSGAERELVSHPGTLGTGVITVREVLQPWPAGAVLVMHSDGLSRRWSLNDNAPLLAKDPNLIAGVLYRDYRRERDDATVVVLKDARTAS